MEKGPEDFSASKAEFDQEWAKMKDLEARLEARKSALLAAEEMRNNQKSDKKAVEEMIFGIKKEISQFEGELWAARHRAADNIAQLHKDREQIDKADTSSVN